MKEWIERVLDEAGSTPGLWEFLVLFVTSSLEYIVPFVPGDLVALAGAVLVGAQGWSLWFVGGAVTGGSIAGLTVEYWFGRWVSRHDQGWRERSPRWRRFGVLIDRVHDVFDRRGSVFICVNRFFPGIRAAFFVAAGISRMPYWKVLLWGTISALVWNALIFVVGVSVGHNRERLFHLFDTYATIAWIVIGVIAVLIFARWRRGRSA